MDIVVVEEPEEAEATEEILGDKDEEVEMAKVRDKVRLTPDTRESGTRMGHRSRPVNSTGFTGNQLFIAWNRGHAHGETILCQEPRTNETLTSSVTKLTKVFFINYFTVTVMTLKK